jgi:hypothetical protein
VAPREELLARLAYGLAAPMQQFAGLLAAVPRNFAYGLQALIEQGGGPNQPEAAPEPEPEAEAAPEPEAEADAPQTTDEAPADTVTEDETEAPADEAETDDTAAEAATETDAPADEADADDPAADDAATTEES